MESIVIGLTNLTLMMNISQAAESTSKLIESFEITFISKKLTTLSNYQDDPYVLNCRL